MRLATPPVRAALENPTVVTCLAVRSDGVDVIAGQAASSPHPALSRWSLPDLTRVDGPDPCPLASHEDICNTMARGGDDLLAVAGMKKRQLTVINLETGGQSTPVDGEVGWAAYAGHLFATSGDEAQIVDLDTGQMVWRQDPPAPRDRVSPSRVPVIAFHPDGRSFAVGGSGEPTVLVYPLGGDEPESTLTGAPDRLNWLGYGPTGEYLAAVHAGAKSTTVWRAGQTEPHLPDVFGENVPYARSVAFHPDGEHVAIGALSGYILIYRLPDGEIVDAQEQHLGTVQAMEFTPDGSLLLSGGDDGKLLAWTVER